MDVITVVEQNMRMNKTFLTHGAAADIWLVETLDVPVTKVTSLTARLEEILTQFHQHISKVIRLDIEGLKRHSNPKSSKNVNELWEGFAHSLQSKARQWSPIHHQNVVRVFGLHEGLDLRVEFCANGTASQFLNKHPHDQIECKARMIVDIVKGVEYLHNQNPPIVHGCINMDKVFVDDRGTAKIGEFGLSALTGHFALLVPSISQVGLGRWMSPELIDLETEDGVMQLTTASDMWALGCTLFEIISGKVPYSECKHELRVRREIMLGKPPGRRDLCINSELDYVWRALDKCWSSTPESRPSAGELWHLLFHNPSESAQFAIADSSPNLKRTLEDPMSSPYWIQLPKNPSYDSTRDSTPAMTPDLTWSSPAEFVWSAADPLSSRTSIPADRASSTASNNEAWAGSVTRGKWLRIDKEKKLKYAACTHCKHLRMKCVFNPPGAAVCQRCQQSGRTCVVGGELRKNSEPVGQLVAQIKDKQEIIDGLLRIISNSRGDGTQPLDTAEVWRWIERAARSLMAAPNEAGRGDEVQLPTESVPFGLLAELSLNRERDNKSHEEGKGKAGTGGSNESQIDEGTEVGVANAKYFRPGPMTHPELRRIIVERQMVPEILTLKVVTDEEVDFLFQIFHEKVDAVIGITDHSIHTVAGVKARCPFLFTVICAIASRYWVERPELYTVLMHHAKSAAATMITDGWKSLEVCQAYLLLSVYPQPTRSWAEDRSWLYLGCAIRLALDLNLRGQGAQTCANEVHEREDLNRTRTWLICFNMDRTLATRLGRPTTMPEDYIVRNSREWWRRSKYNGRLDVHLCYYTQLLRTVTRYLNLIYSDPESLSGLNESVEFGPITRAFDDEMEQFRQDAEHAYSAGPDPQNPIGLYRLALMPLAIAYYRLVMYSFGLEHAHQSASEPGNIFLIRSVDTALEVLRITNEDLPMYEYHRYSPDGHWMWSMFAAAFLIKLAKPRTVQPPHLTMTESQRMSSLASVRKLIATLEHSAADAQHSPALYARFLKRILSEPTEMTTESLSRPPAGGVFESASSGAAQSSGSSTVFMDTTGTSARVGFNPASNVPSPEADVPGAIYLTGDFWDNALTPGTWGILNVSRR